MTDNNVLKLNKLEQNDPLQEVLREGARKMLAADRSSSLTVDLGTALLEAYREY